MASGSMAMLTDSSRERGSTAFLDFTYSCQASAEHFQQCAEFLLLRNRGLGPLAVTVLPIPLARRAPLPLAPPCNRQRLFSSLVIGRVSRFSYALRTDGLSEIAEVVGAHSVPRPP
jgi:hypothetical protein